MAKQSADKTLIQRKNQWLRSQVEVDYPTKESLIGRDLYFHYTQSQETVQLSLDTISPASPQVDEFYLVDFHRLTIIFSLLQSAHWPQESDQAMIVEFLSQIILDGEVSLYVGFYQQEAVCAAIVTQEHGAWLISDTVSAKGNLSGLDIAHSLYHHLADHGETAEQLFVELPHNIH